MAMGMAMMTTKAIAMLVTMPLAMTLIAMTATMAPVTMLIITFEKVMIILVLFVLIS